MCSIPHYGYCILIASKSTTESLLIRPGCFLELSNIVFTFTLWNLLRRICSKFATSSISLITSLRYPFTRKAAPSPR